MTEFIIGLLVGGVIGMIAMVLSITAKESDKEMEK